MEHTVQRFNDHLERAKRQLGKRVSLGSGQFHVRGYISNLLSIDAPHEPELDTLLERLLRDQGYFIDVGMNLGQTFGKVLSADPGRDYVGFEPQVFPCALVAQFIEDNGLTRCHALPFGLSNSDGIRTLYSDGPADTMASFSKDEAGAKKTLVPVRIGDDVIAELGIDRIAAIKIDVEGAEFEVLEGLSNTIATLAPPVIFEVLPNYEGDGRTPVPKDVAERQSASAQQIFEFFTQKNGYRIFQLLPSSEEVAIDAFDLDSTDMFLGTNFIARKA